MSINEPLDRCTNCGHETHDVDALHQCHNCRPRVEAVAFGAHTIDDQQYFRLHAVIDGKNRLLLETQAQYRASELLDEITNRGGPDCDCGEVMVCASAEALGVFWECPECEGESKSLDAIENDRDNRDEREGMRAMRRKLEGAHDVESPSYRQQMRDAGRGHLL